MDEGYILSNKYRRAVFDELIAGEYNIKRIAKKHRMVPKIAIRVMDDFEQGGIVKRNGSRYELTEEGRKLAATLG